MKNQILLLLSLTTLYSIAQSPIEPTYDNHNYGKIQDAYYTDIDNFQDQFVGTWKYTNGNTSLEVKFIKKVMVYNATNYGKSYYEDVLIGGVKYIENGITKTNTLGSLLLNLPTIYNYYLCSYTRIRPNAFPHCNDCTADEKRLRVNYDDTTTKNVKALDADFVIRRVVENNIEKLKVQFVAINSSLGKTNNDQPTLVDKFQLPYTKIKI